VDRTAATAPRVSARLGTDEAISFWDSRHRTVGDLRSGGDLGHDEAVNAIFYALRLGRLLDVIGDSTEGAAPLRVLDAGCGKGWFSRALAQCGHQVDGIDSSEHAVAQCQRLAVGNDRYAVSRLDGWAPPYLYDVVASIDVLFHVMDDAVWEASVRNLASLVRLGGRLLLADHDADHDMVWGEYQVTRAGSRYRALVTGLGFRSDGFTAYRFRDNAAGFHAFTRTA